MDSEAQLVQAPAVTQLAAKGLRPSTTAKKLSSEISVTVPANTTVLDIACESSTASRAAACANADGRGVLVRSAHRRGEPRHERALGGAIQSPVDNAGGRQTKRAAGPGARLKSNHEAHSAAPGQGGQQPAECAGYSYERPVGRTREPRRVQQHGRRSGGDPGGPTELTDLTEDPLVPPERSACGIAPRPARRLLGRTLATNASTNLGTSSAPTVSQRSWTSATFAGGLSGTSSPRRRSHPRRSPSSRSMWRPFQRSDLSCWPWAEARPRA